MRHEVMTHEAKFGRLPCCRPRKMPLALLALLVGGSFAPHVSEAQVKLVVVDIVAVADGYRFSKLRGQTVRNTQNEELGELDDLIVGKDRVLFAIIEVGGFLGIGSHLIAVPYTSLQIADNGNRIVLPNATKQNVKELPEFRYR
jgi:uncharacterized membrane protein YfcA